MAYKSEELLHHERDLNRALFGVLVDVSGSMERAFAVDSSKDASVERVHAIITTTLKIVNTEVSHHNSSDEIFVSAFGLDMVTDTCDLIALLDLIAGPKSLRGKKPHDALVDLANEHGAAHAARWIREYINQDDAHDLYRVICFDESLIPELIQKIPPESRNHKRLASIRKRVPGGSVVEGLAVHNSEAYCYAKELVKAKGVIIEKKIKEKLDTIKFPKPRSFQYVAQLLEDLNIKDESVGSKSLHSQIKELIKPIRPYIFGGTPMCKALSQALSVFQQSQANTRVLLLLSDGESADGNPYYASQRLERSNVTRVSCFLTDAHIENARCLLDQAPSDWPKNDGRLTLFNFSSPMRNIDPPISYLVDAGWTLPVSGESRLFVQANSLDVVDELCKIVVSRLADHCDSMVDILEKVPLAAYINHKGTCYANSVATVFHLAMHRIVGREGGYPEFEEIRDNLIQEYGVVSAKTRDVIAKVCPEYRLHFQEVDEVHARQALNHRRPLVATFSLFDKQWDRFNEFYTSTPKGILKKSNIGDGSNKPAGHAVVLIRCSPDRLVFMNSWGQGWADGGFFSVKDSEVLNNVKFFDVYWTEEDLTQGEKEAYHKQGIERAKKLAKQFPSINDLLVECPRCKQRPRVGEIEGDLTEAVCPRCGNKFRPTNEDLVKSLYLRSMY